MRLIYHKIIISSVLPFYHSEKDSSLLKRQFNSAIHRHDQLFYIEHIYHEGAF